MIGHRIPSGIRLFRGEVGCNMPPYQLRDGNGRDYILSCSAGNRSPTPYAAGGPAGDRRRGLGRGAHAIRGCVPAAAARRTNIGLWVAVASELVVAKKRMRFRRSAGGQERTRSAAAAVEGHAWACDK